MASDAIGSPSGAQLAAAAYALPPLTPKGLSLGIVVFSILFAIITTAVACLRIWVRMGMSGSITRTWGVEDYFFVLGFVPFIPSVVFAVLAAHYGVGLHDADLLSPLYAIRAGEYVIYWEIHYFISSTIIKCAIGFACMRIDGRKRVKYPISLNIVVMVITAILALAFVFANCKPLAATWNPSLGHCQTTISLELVSYIVSAIQAVTDWAFALIPCYIVSKLQMPRRRKLSVICILGLGILASIATLIRMPYLRYYDTDKYPHEFLFHVGIIVMCSSAECSLGIIACSLPPLRKFLQVYYENWSSNHYGAQSNNIASSGTKLTSLKLRQPYHSGSGKGSGGRWDELDDASSREGIVRRTSISITTP